MKNFVLSVPTPCHENWHNMTPQENGRFCAACQKTVVDFTNMSDRQIAEFFKKSHNVCGRFKATQLHRELEMPRKQLPWVRYFFPMALPAFLLSLKASAQREWKGKVAVCVQPGKNDAATLPAKPEPQNVSTLKGKVVNEKGEPIAGATVQLKERNIVAQTDNDGLFHLQHETSGPATIMVSSVGYESKSVALDAKDTAAVLLVPLSAQSMGDEVVVVGFVSTKRKRTPAVPLLQATKTKAAFSKFSVFPNPAASHSAITVEAKKIEDGTYRLAIVNGFGVAVQVNEVVVGKNKKRVTIALNALPAGPYFVQLTSRHSGKVYSEAILVQ